MTPTELLEKIAQLEEVANRDLRVWPDPRTLPGAQTAQRQAQDAIEEYRKQYEQYLKQSAATLLLEGPEANQSKFSALAEDEGGAIVVDGRNLYDTICRKAWDSMRQGEHPRFNVNQSSLIIMEMREVAAYLKLDEFNRPNFNTAEGTAYTTFDQLVNAVRDVVRRDVGDQMNRLWIERKAVESAAQLRVTGTVVPAVVMNLTGEEVNVFNGTLFRGVSVVVDVSDSEIDKNTVIKAFNQLKEKLRPTRNQNKNKEK